MNLSKLSGYMADGKIFETKAEALDYLRKPQKEEALNKLNDNNKELTEWLLENEESICAAFDSNKIRRVTKKDRNSLSKALQKLGQLEIDGVQFLVQNAEAILESFRWPSVKRTKPEDQEAVIFSSIMDLTDENEELTKWIIENKQAILDSYQAGVVKREVSPKAEQALAEYRARKAAEKAAKEAANGNDTSSPSSESDEDSEAESKQQTNRSSMKAKKTK